MLFDTTVGGILALSTTLLVLSTLSVVFRFYGRKQQESPYKMDDWLTIPAWVFFVGLTALSYYGVAHRFMGYHMPHDKAYVDSIHPMREKVYLTLDALAILVFGLVKLSALFFYRRVLCTKQRGVFKYITTILIIIVTLWTITFFIMTFTLCGPDIKYLWPAGNTNNCKLIMPYFMMTTISDFCLDFLIICLPIPQVWSLQIKTKQKVAVCGVFLLTLAGLGASTARMAITIHLVKQGRAVDEEDSYQSNSQWCYYVILEAGLTLVAVNLPSLWYFIVRIRPDQMLRKVRNAMPTASRCSTSSLGRDAAVQDLDISLTYPESHDQWVGAETSRREKDDGAITPVDITNYSDGRIGVARPVLLPSHGIKGHDVTVNRV